MKISLLVEQKNGNVEVFNPSRITKSLITETGMTVDEAQNITKKVKKILKSVNKPIKITGPLIREIACTVMLQNDMDHYRRKYTRIGIPIYDANKISQGFGKGDNANLQNSPETIHKRKADKLSKEQWLLTLPPEIAELHIKGDIHIHDLEYFGERQFCLDSDLRFFFYYGFVGDGTGTHTSYAGPAKRPGVAILHAAKVLGCSQVCCAGGQGFYNFLCFIAPFFKDEPYDTYKQCMQMFCYEMTQMLVARGGQTVFSSVQLSPGIPKIWKNIPIVYQGHIWDGNDKPLIAYGEFEKENRLLFKALMEVMLEGDAHGKPFNFPKPEVNISPEFTMDDWDIPDESGLSYKDLYLMSFELASKFGTPYFDNTIPDFRHTGGIECYQCCAYSFNSNSNVDTKFDDKLYFKNGEHFSMGSLHVITVNLPRLAYKVKELNKKLDNKKIVSLMLTEFEQLIPNIKELFRIKRELIMKMADKNMIPFLTQHLYDKKGNISPPLVDFGQLVNTVGIIGMNEVIKILTGKFMHEDENGIKIAINLCIAMKCLCQNNGLVFSRTPAETTGQRFAILDLINGYSNFICQGDIEESKKFIAQGNMDCPIYYTNGTHMSPNAPIQAAQRIQYEQAFFPVLDGGNIAHIWLGEARPDPHGLMDMTMNLCNKTNVGYFAFTRDFTMRINFYRDYDEMHVSN